jgi:hypothetical protein
LDIECLVGRRAKERIGSHTLLVRAKLGNESFESICTTCRWRACIASCDKISGFTLLIPQIAEHDIEKEKTLALICLGIAQLDVVKPSIESTLDIRSASMLYLATTIRKNTTSLGGVGTVIGIMP